LNPAGRPEGWAVPSLPEREPLAHLTHRAIQSVEATLDPVEPRLEDAPERLAVGGANRSADRADAYDEREDGSEIRTQVAAALATPVRIDKFGTRWRYYWVYTYKGSKCGMFVSVEYQQQWFERTNNFPSVHIVTVYEWKI
jgi:hypothetical protein